MAKNPKYDPTDPAIVPRFSDIATLLRTKRLEATEEVDIGLCGVPFDLAVNYRAGQRSGPAAVREASRLIRRCHPTSGIAPFDIANICDIGDCLINPMNKEKSIDQIEAYFDGLMEKGITPIAIGGDHTIPLPILRALKKKYGKMGILHVDAHADVLDTICGDKINHATFMRRAMEEGILDPERVIQIGMRGSRFEPEDFTYSLESGYTVITMDDYEEMGRKAAIEKIVTTLGDGPIYISIDIDGLDPAYMPGTGVPELGGIIPRDMQVILRALQGKEIVGADICEYAPALDPTGITGVGIANLAFEILCITADSLQKYGRL
ncbi:guanidinobutyrase [Microbulbifer donghaiensis]|uniref:Guanidinobutyrase n=1 Tax=Microbulbifer donghaiensis TaxID=494016 RepID=A0A1M4UJM6_9GAMM|nr:agmatinase [Microbulbifer donghaiensis]SHE56897.1 guanidinobutyrase [Microbulbifer donghaiensis]